MHTPSLFVASVAVLSSFAIAEPERPKFYFPRQVKRQIYSNSTVTTQATLPAAYTTSDFTSSSRRSLSDILSGLTSSGQTSSAGTTGNILGNSILPLQPTSSSSSSPASSSSVVSSSSIDGVTTVVVPQTVIDTYANTAEVATTPATTPTTTATASSPSAALASESVLPYLPLSILDTSAAASGAAPNIIVQPTTASTSDITTASDAPAASSMTGILFAPGGVVTTYGSAAAASSIATTSAEPPAAESVTPGVLYSGTAASTAPAASPTTIPDIVPILSNVDSALSGAAATPTPTIGATESSAPTTIAGISGVASAGVLPPELLPTTAAAPTTIAGISGLALTGVYPTELPTTAAAPTTTAGISDLALTGVYPTELPTTAAAPSSQYIFSPFPSTPTDAPASAAAASSSQVHLPSLSTAGISGPASPGVAAMTDVPSAGTSTDLNSINAMPGVETASASTSGLSTSATTATSTPIPTYSIVSTPASSADSSGSVTSTPTGSAQPTTYAGDNNTSIIGTTLAGYSQTRLTTGAAASTTASASPSISTDTSAPTNGTFAGISTMLSTTSTADIPTTSMNASSSLSAAASTTPQSIAPIGSNTATSMEIPSTIVVQPSPTYTDSATATAMPSGLPLVIVPEGGTPAAPEDSTLIQLGFLFPLNYQFVVGNSTSSLQIFAYLPAGIADGLCLKPEEIVMHSLVPYNTQASLGYITTIALAFIPTNMVTTLQLDLHIPTATIYNNPDVTLNTLVNYINPAIPITGSLTGGSGASGTDSNSVATYSAASGNGGVFNPDSQGQTPAVEGATAGIVVGAVGAAAAYGAAMFFVARRYKRRKQGHRRSSSIQSPAEMRQSGSQAFMGGTFMSGGRTTPGVAPNGRDSRGSGRSAGNSARTQQISAPMMAENSLGWN